MSDATPAYPRVRQACDPCRRKKTKCPGERPACSFCTRLGQNCHYEGTPEADHLRVQKPRASPVPKRSSTSGDRIHKLEARMNQVVEAVKITPPSGALEELVKIYTERFADQPLPLFDAITLATTVPTFSPVLMRSFLALTVSTSNHVFFEGTKAAAVEFYKRSARDLLFNQISEPTGSLEVVQAACLLCLSEIAEGKMVRASMLIGIAGRIATSMNLAMYDMPRTTARRSDFSRCFWSVFVLDRIHGSGFRTIPAISDEVVMPEMPPYAKQPPSRTAAPAAPDDLGAGDRDDGINSYALQLLSIWGRLMSYLKTFKQGSMEDAWKANSPYQQIKSEMSRFETVFPETHRFKNARFHERSSQSLATHRDYWAPWIFTQCIYHTIYCTLNHPFLHVARIHDRQRLRSPSFLQHSTDQAILHSAWIVHIFNQCEDRGFEIFDPFIAQLASMVATAHFFLQFSKDNTLAATTSRDFHRLRDFVQIMSVQHLHLKNTAFKLSKLAQYAVPDRTLQPPKVETALLWDLFDYAISSSPITSASSASDDVELNVNTQFLSPLTQDLPPAQQPSAAFGAASPAMMTPNFWDDAAFEFDMADFSNLPDTTSLPLPRDFWINGHL